MVSVDVLTQQEAPSFLPSHVRLSLPSSGGLYSRGKAVVELSSREGAQALLAAAGGAGGGLLFVGPDVGSSGGRARGYIE